MKTLKERQQKVSQGILKAFKGQFGLEPHLEDGEEFETVWPISKWDRIHTWDRSFDVELSMTTGKVVKITEETL